MDSLKYTGQRVLILAPHADDETIGCGGVIQKYIQQNSQIRIVVASFVLGDYKRYQKDSGVYKNYSGSVRMNELKNAMNLLGVADYHILFKDKSPDIKYHSKLDLLPRVELVEKIEKHINAFKPTVIYIPSVTKHQDHEILHESAVTAARPYYWQGSLIVYETDGELVFQPNLYVPLTSAEMAGKANALQAYQTQLGTVQHPVSVEALYSKAKFRGYQIYAEYAEAFQILRLHG